MSYKPERALTRKNPQYTERGSCRLVEMSYKPERAGGADAFLDLN